MILEDCICFGRTVPEDSKKYGRKVCSVFYSPELRNFIRVYPLMIDNPVRMRYRCRLELTRNPNDNREESWKLKDPVNSILDVQPSPKALQSDHDVFSVLQKHEESSIQKLNLDRKSIGVVRADLIGRMKVNGGVIKPEQKELFDDVYECFGYRPKCIPYLRFRDSGGIHEIQVREWGVWEFIRKYPDKSLRVFDALGIDKNPHNYLVVGNMLNRRNNWLVIACFKTEPVSSQQTLFAAV